MDTVRLRKLFGRLKGIRHVTSTRYTTTKAVGDDYNAIVKEIGTIVNEDTSTFLLVGQYFYQSQNGDWMC